MSNRQTMTDGDGKIRNCALHPESFACMGGYSPAARVSHQPGREALTARDQNPGFIIRAPGDSAPVD